MTVADQLRRLLELGVADAAGVSAATFVAYGEDLPDEPDVIVAVHPAVASARRLAPLLQHRNRPGFVVEDLTDLEEFGPIDDLDVPESPLYLIHQVDRGDDLRNWSPDEALPAITAHGRTPLTINEGVSWLLQEPKALEPGHCFMTIGSRKIHGKRLDARTPAVWISGGTGRDGQGRRGAPKIGWCWAGNRHTWLGFASARRRSPLPGRAADEGTAAVSGR
jgi:hypothetical protein